MRIRGVIPLDDANAAAPLAALSASTTPTGSFYVRSNFSVPDPDVESWRLTVGGLVGTPARYSLADLTAWGIPVSGLVTVECAGNGRLLMDPVPGGTPWGLGAVSVGEFTGVPLHVVLREARPEPEAVEWVFTGADRGAVEPDGEVNYAFSLERDLAEEEGPILAWEMNGEPLPPEHGYPLRLVVPGHYGMRSVKWLTSIVAVGRPFTGHFRRKYRFFGDPVASEEEPVGEIRVRSLVTSPGDRAVVGGRVEVAGVAWSGAGRVVRVDVSLDEGPWQEARLGSPLSRHSPTPWSLELDAAPGEHQVRSRATDASGAAQPTDPVWNRNGYANNVVHAVRFMVG